MTLCDYTCYSMLYALQQNLVEILPYKYSVHFVLRSDYESEVFEKIFHHLDVMVTNAKYEL